ncbi:MAG: AtpZ/AtpI family protein [Acidobacteriota bacterium]
MGFDYKKMVVYSHIAYTFPSIVLGMALIGYFLDKKFETYPSLTVVGFFIGLIGGFWNVFRLLNYFKEKE